MDDRVITARLETLAAKLDGLSRLTEQRLATADEAMARGRERFADQEERIRALESAASRARGGESSRRSAWATGLEVVGIIVALGLGIAGLITK